MRALLILFIAAMIPACGAPQGSPSQAAQHGALEVRDAWAAPTPVGVDVSAGYLVIENNTAAGDRLLAATSPRAERLEIHEMTMDGAVMRMRPVERLVVPAGGAVELAPGGMHLMFYGVAEPFAEGQNIPVQLTFETAGAIDLSLPVSRAAPAAHGAH